MASVSQLAYLVFGVSDLKAWGNFSRRVLGLTTIEKDNYLLLRYDKRAYRIILIPDVADDLLYVGWEAASEKDFIDIVAGLEKDGVTVKENPELRNQRRVKRLASFSDPANNKIELVVDPALGDNDFFSRKVLNGYTAGELGMGHVAINSRTRQESETFYCKHLGLRLSDRIRADLKVMKTDIAFLRANRRHHSLAIGGPLGRTMHHFMLQMNSLDDVGRAYDRAMKRNLVATSLGRHSNDQMVSFYLDTPSGFQLELGWGGLEVDEAKWESKTYDHIAIWGHRNNSNHH